MSSVFYGKCVEDVSAGQFGVFVLSCSALSCGMLCLAVYLYSKSEFCILPVNDQRDADMEMPPALVSSNEYQTTCTYDVAHQRRHVS